MFPERLSSDRPFNPSLPRTSLTLFWFSLSSPGFQESPVAWPHSLPSPHSCRSISTSSRALFHPPPHPSQWDTAPGAHTQPSPLQFGIPPTQLWASQFRLWAQPALSLPRPGWQSPSTSSSARGCLSKAQTERAHSRGCLGAAAASRSRAPFARPACLSRAIWPGSASKPNLLDGFEGH